MNCEWREPSSFWNGRSFSSINSSSIAAFNSLSEKNCRLRKRARIQRSTICTPVSTLDLSRGLRTRAGKIATPTDLALCDYLLAQPQAVAAVPGSAFGSEGCLRVSFATSMDHIKKAVERMTTAIGDVRVAA